MNTRRLSLSLLRITVLSVVLAFDSARAQCHEWSEAFARPSFNDAVRAWAVFDDGSGPALYAGGAFTAAGSTNANRIAKWTGTHWTALPGTGMNAHVFALAVFDDGSGPALYAAGTFGFAGGVNAWRIAKWDGLAWSPLGAGMSAYVNALAVYDDGSGPALYAGGIFTTAGGASANRIAKWDGSSWSPLGTGLDGEVMSLTVHDDGSGSALFAGGSFTDAGGAPAAGIAKWNGSTWSALDSGVSGGAVHSLGVFDDGTGAALYAGGSFDTAGGAPAAHIAKWNGVSWSALDAGVQGGPDDRSVRAIATFDDGTGPALYAGGRFEIAGSVAAHDVAKWNGSSWSALGDGVNAQVYAFISFDTGDGQKLHAGGGFHDDLVGPIDESTRWNGSSWEPFGGEGLNSTVHVLATIDDGSGPALYAGGDFTEAGSVLAARIARWDGTTWSPLGAGLNGTVSALSVYDDGAGPAIYAGGSFTQAGGMNANRIAKWDGATWSPLGTGLSGAVYALVVHDDGSGPALFAGGGFTTAGGTSASRIAKWDGATWTAVGGGLDSTVNALASFDDGAGLHLFAGGLFTSSQGVTLIRRVGRWNGAGWSEVSGGTSGDVNALAVYDDGSGDALYVGGHFSVAGAGAVTSAGSVAKWNGSNWSALGVGVSTVAPSIPVLALGVHDDGGNPALYVGGEFTMAGGMSAIGVAKWDGSSWSTLAGGVNGGVYALAEFNDGANGAPDLYAGGAFGYAGTIPSSRIAMWHGCEPGDAYCFGDGLDPVITAQCPCGNFGEPGRGCANSNATLGGARLFASGSTNPNTLVFTCTGVPNNNLCTFLRGTANDAGGGVFGDGVRCASGTLVRFGQQTAGQGGNASNTAAAPAATVATGNTRYYQVHYRNPAAGFCPPGLFNFSNGYSVAW